jgi:hypothetical protein
MLNFLSIAVRLLNLERFDHLLRCACVRVVVVGGSLVGQHRVFDAEGRGDLGPVACHQSPEDLLVLPLRTEEGPSLLGEGDDRFPARLLHLDRTFHVL